MVLQGANAPRVLQVESDEIVAAVKKNNVPTEYMVFPDEGHGFVKKENEMMGYSGVLTFLDKYLMVPVPVKQQVGDLGICSARAWYFLSFDKKECRALASQILNHSNPPALHYARLFFQS
jgi:hypothetical protein